MSVVKVPKNKPELDLESLRLKPEDLTGPKAKAELQTKPDRDYLHESMTRLAIGLNAGGGTVWAYLLRQTRMKRSPTIRVANQSLARLGVNRKAKIRTLRRLEAAGLILVEWQKRRSPLVKVLA